MRKLGNRQFGWLLLLAVGLLAGQSAKAEFTPDEPLIVEDDPTGGADWIEPDDPPFDPPPDEIIYPDDGECIVPEYFGGTDPDSLPSDLEDYVPDPGEPIPPPPCGPFDDWGDGSESDPMIYTMAALQESQDLHNPEPASLVLFGLGLAGLAGGSWFTDRQKVRVLGK